MTQTNLQTVLDVDPELIYFAALGTDTLDNIGARYGLSPEQIEKLRGDPAFKRATLLQEAELSKTGVTFKFRSAMTAERALRVLHQRLATHDTPTSVILDIYKATSKLAGLEPVANVQVPQGSGFSINIVLGGGKREGVVIEDASAVDVTDAVELTPPSYIASTQNSNSDLDYEE